MKGAQSENKDHVVISQSGGAFCVVLSGHLDLTAASRVWKKIDRALSSFTPQSIQIEAKDLSYCDGGGISVLLKLQRMAGRLSIPYDVNGLASDYEKLLKLYPLDKLENPSAAQPKGSRTFVEETGKAAVDTVTNITEQVEFLGEVTSALLKTTVRPAQLRVKDLLIIADASGVRALPIIMLLGLLVGLIMAFQGAVLMAEFGAEIYIADFVGMSVIRELGPLITAIIVAGRTGSAFAAELGTMKVNEEIDAFTTMGLDPVRFLVVPRVIAATLMTPVLTVFANLAGLIGGAIVMTGIGYPLITYVSRAMQAVSSIDFAGGLVKSLVFGLLISTTGCLCGLRTGEGASAVGNSATRAVVNSIVLIVLADGLFAVLFFYLGI